MTVEISRYFILLCEVPIIAKFKELQRQRRASQIAEKRLQSLAFSHDGRTTNAPSQRSSSYYV
jgi:hypothetical protein